MNSRKAEWLMASVSLAWGSSYLLMKVGLEGIGPYDLITLRFGIAFLAMTVLFLPRYRDLTFPTLGKGIVMGIILFLIFYGMVNGVNHTTASTAGFLTSTTVVMVPVLECLLNPTTIFFLIPHPAHLPMFATAVFCRGAAENER